MAAITTNRDANWYRNDAQFWYSFYWWIHFALFWAIPILSTLLASSAFTHFFTTADGKQSPALLVMTVILSIMTIVNSAIKPKDRFEENAGYKIRFEQYDTTYATEEMRVRHCFKDDPDIDLILNDWKEFKQIEFLGIVKAYLTSGSVPRPEKFVYNGKALSPSIPQPSMVSPTTVTEQPQPTGGDDGNSVQHSGDPAS